MKYLALVFWSDEDEGYIAVAPDLPGCSAFGNTPEEAVREIGDATEARIAACRAARRSGAGAGRQGAPGGVRTARPGNCSTVSNHWTLIPLTGVSKNNYKLKQHPWVA
jgi:predicted RNase H-like HicB family nuclease